MEGDYEIIREEFNEKIQRIGEKHIKRGEKNKRKEKIFKSVLCVCVTCSITCYCCNVFIPKQLDMAQ